MNLLYVTVSLPFGVVEAFTIPEICALIDRGHDVRVLPVVPSGPVVHHASAGPLLPQTIQSRLITFAMLLETGKRFLCEPRKSSEIVKLLLRSRNWKVMLKNFAALPKGVWLAGRATEWHLDHIHACWASVPATLAMIASEYSGIPFSFSAHRWDITEDNLFLEKTKRSAFARFISTDGLETARMLGFLDRADKAIILHLGVNIPDVSTSPATNGNGEAVLLCPAFLSARKGHTYLFEAVRHLLNEGVPCRLLLAGDGEEASTLKLEVQRLGLADSVTFLGHIAHHELLRWYRGGEVSVVVLPTLHEGIPVSLMEAMAHGVPVVSTTVGGMPELLGGGAGVMVPPADSRALADALRFVLTNPAQGKQMADIAQRRVREDFSAEAVSRYLERLFSLATGT